MSKIKVNWKIIKELVDSGMKLVDIERKFNGIVTAAQISKKKAQWNKKEYFSSSSKYAKYNTPQYKKWRAAVLKRDKEKCTVCGRGRPARLQADHIKSWSMYPELRFSVDNGRTLCIPCHKRTPNYGFKAKTYENTPEKDAEWVKSEKDRIKLMRLKKKLKGLK